MVSETEERAINGIIAREALKVLTPEEARAVRLYYWEGLRCLDIAGILGVTERTVNRMIATSTVKMRRFVDRKSGYFLSSMN